MSQQTLTKRIGDLISRGALLFVFGMIVLGLRDPRFVIANIDVPLPGIIYQVYAGTAFLISILFFLAIPLGKLGGYLQQVFDRPVSRFQRLCVLVYWFAFLVVLITGLVEYVPRVPRNEYLQMALLIFGFVWILTVGFMLVRPAFLLTRRRTAIEEQKDVKPGRERRLSKWSFPWCTYRWLEWSRFCLGILLLALGKFEKPVFGDTLELSVWAYTMGAFVLFHLLVIDSVITKLEVPEYVRMANHSERVFTMSTTRYWMETVRTLTYWTIAVSGVVIGILVSDTEKLTPLSQLGLVALVLAIVCGFFYNIALIAGIQTEQGETLIVNRRRFRMGHAFFNLMFTSFVAGVVALVLTSIKA